MFYKVLSANSLGELQNTVNEHLNSGYQLQGGLVVLADEESGPIVREQGAPAILGEHKAADRWTRATVRTTYLQAVCRNAVAFNPTARLSPHITDN